MEDAHTRPVPETSTVLQLVDQLGEHRSHAHERKDADVLAIEVSNFYAEMDARTHDALGQFIALAYRVVLVTVTDPHPELVAHHFTQSGQIELASEWWGKAGEAALRRSAFQEAIA